MIPIKYVALAIGGLLALSSPAEAKPVDFGSKAAAHFRNPDVDYEKKTFCYDASSRRWIVPHEACEDARYVASMTLDSYLRKLDISTNARGIAMLRCAPKEVSVPGGQAYEADARACFSLTMYDPYTVDKILEDVDSAEGQLEGYIFNGYTHTTFGSAVITSGSSEKGYDRKITKSEGATVVENYGVTNRALPWVTALSELLRRAGFDDRQKGDVWKWVAGDGKVLKKQDVKSMYETLRGEMEKKL